MRSLGRWRSAWICLLFVIACGRPCSIRAQQPDTAPAPQEEEERPIVRNSTVGYVDSAIPANVLRFRYDSAYNNTQPTRGEFFYAQTGPGGHGLPMDEKSVDFQDISLYAEHLFTEKLSAFVDVPFRFANFEVNQDHSGLSDMNAGIKYALVSDEMTVLTTQFRVYAPTGNARLGLGNHHVSLEPALLLYHSFSEQCGSESELRFWRAVGGTSHVQGSLIRYGTGLHYDVLHTCNLTVAPVVELVGWTFLDGGKDGPFGAPDTAPMPNAAGDTIINAKMGVRFKLNEGGDFYAGYGRALTGDVLYKDLFRFEFRILY